MSLHNHLERLEAHGLLRRLGAEPEADYAFYRALALEAVCHTLVRQEHREIHFAAGAVMEAEFASRLEAVAPALGAHFDEAGEYERAGRYDTLAAQADGERPMLWRLRRELGRLHQAQAQPAAAEAEFAQARQVAADLAATPPDGAARAAFWHRVDLLRPRRRPISRGGVPSRRWPNRGRLAAPGGHFYFGRPGDISILG